MHSIDRGGRSQAKLEPLRGLAKKPLTGIQRFCQRRPAVDQVYRDARANGVLERAAP